MNNIMVSICCIAYNHENYIADAIESFLMQKTDFDFEILIHDDASSDRTADIIREYESAYPSIVKPIYQTENKYSKGILINPTYNYARAQGKYIAICEGDDYWTDPGKLQKQVAYMEDHPQCSMSVHAAYAVTPDKNKINKIRPSVGDRLLTVEEIIYRGGPFIATNSIVFQAQYRINRPDFFTKTRVGDYPLVIYLALQGDVYCIDEYMSAYRTGVSGSWNNRVFEDIEKRKRHYEEIGEMLDAVNTYSDYKYNKIILDTKYENEFDFLPLQQKIAEMRPWKYRKFYAHYLKSKAQDKIYQNFPSLYEMLKRHKSNLDYNN